MKHKTIQKFAMQKRYIFDLSEGKRKRKTKKKSISRLKEFEQTYQVESPVAAGIKIAIELKANRHNAEEISIKLDSRKIQIFLLVTKNSSGTQIN